MSAASRLGVRGEFIAADILGTERIPRERGKSLPDMKPTRLPSGTILQGEAKARERIPRRLRRWLAQADSYTPGAIPCVILIDLHGEPIAFFRARDIARELGLSAPALQLSLVPQPEKNHGHH